MTLSMKTLIFQKRMNLMRTIKSVYQGMTKNQLKEEINTIKKGCGKKVNSDGDCFYYSSQGNLRLCSTCSRHLKIAKEIYGDKK